MNCLMGDPTTEKVIELIAPAAHAVERLLSLIVDGTRTTTAGGKRLENECRVADDFRKAGLL